MKWFAVLLVFAGFGAVGLERWNASQVAAERQTLETRAFDLVTRAMTPGSALACLDARGSGGLEEGCERALFSTPERTAAAVSYVSAQLSLLAAGREYSKRTGVDYGAALARLRQSAEWDGFGIVAHVLATREGCRADACAALAMLDDPQRVRSNLAGRPFDARVTHYAAAWNSRSEHADTAQHPEPAAPNDQVAATEQVGQATPPPRKPNNYFFPSANSIPPVSIMSAEPDEPPAARNRPVPAEATAARKSTPRATASVTTNPASGPTPTRSAAVGPLPLTPGGN